MPSYAWRNFFQSTLTDSVTVHVLSHHLDGSLRKVVRENIIQMRRCNNAHYTTSCNTLGRPPLLIPDRDSQFTRFFSVQPFDGNSGDQRKKHGKNHCVTLKYGRARRKWESKHRVDNAIISTSRKPMVDDKEVNKPALDQTASSSENDSEENEATKKGTVSDILFGKPLESPIRHKYRKTQYHFPNTWNGWKSSFQRVWTTYLSTFEGFITKEKKRDADGNIIEEGKDDAGDQSKDENSLQEKAKEVAGEIASNVQKNISTIQQESPTILQMGQQITGISTKEELRAWVGEQLKLATECLAQFMKGYRVGRDDEVDKMLHEYFKEVDEQKEPEHAHGSSNNDVGSMMNEIDIDSNVKELVKRENRSWGRKKRRRLKSVMDKSDSFSLETSNV